MLENRKDPMGMIWEGLASRITEAKTKVDMSTWQYKELERLGYDLSRAEEDSEGSYNNVNYVDVSKKGYKYLERNSGDDTLSLYSNGKYVITQIASTTGMVSIMKLGVNAKKKLAAGKFDFFNDFLDESGSGKIKSIILMDKKRTIEKKMEEVLLTVVGKKYCESINCVVYVGSKSEITSIDVTVTKQANGEDKEDFRDIIIVLEDRVGLSNIEDENLYMEYGLCTLKFSSEDSWDVVYFITHVTKGSKELDEMIQRVY